MNFYRHHLGDFDGGTMHLGWLSHSAYLRLLHQYYRRECALPLDLDECCRLARASNPAQRKAVRDVISEFFIKEIDGYHNKRADREIAEYRLKAAKASDSAHARWDSERNANASETHMRTHCDGNASHKPIAKSQNKSSVGHISTTEAPPDRKGNGEDKPKITKAGMWAVELRKLNVKTTSIHPTMLKLIEDGFELPAVIEALEIARQRKPHPELIAIGYLDPIVRNPPQAAQASWWASEPATLAKAAECGITPRPGEDWNELRDRIRTHTPRARQC